MAIVVVLAIVVVVGSRTVVVVGAIVVVVVGAAVVVVVGAAVVVVTTGLSSLSSSRDFFNVMTAGLLAALCRSPARAVSQQR